jgi:hypothetical protein
MAEPVNPAAQPMADRADGARTHSSWVLVVLVVGAQQLFGVVEGVGSWLTAIQVGWGIHSVRPSARLRVCQPPGPSSR